MFVVGMLGMVSRSSNAWEAFCTSSEARFGIRERADAAPGISRSAGPSPAGATGCIDVVVFAAVFCQLLCCALDVCCRHLAPKVEFCSIEVAAGQ
jgi:hypothetical protein